MASLLSENLSCINGVDHDHILQHSNFLLMSLLEETQGDQLHYNDEEFGNMIRSLEEEINPNPNPKTMEEQDHDFDTESRLLIDDVEFMDGQDCSDSINDLDLAWDDDHMEQLSSPSPSDDLNLCMDIYGNHDEMDCIVEFGGAVDDQYYYGVSLEDHVYSSVWHQTIDTVIY